MIVPVVAAVAPAAPGAPAAPRAPATPVAPAASRSVPPLFVSPAPLPTYAPPSALPSARPALAPAVVLARYAKALRALRVPHAVTFDYTVEQTGPRDLVQTHRIYRQGESERDETTALDGYVLKRPPIRIVEEKRDRYALGRLAPRPNAYAFAYLGSSTTGGRTTYAFATRRRKPGGVAVERVAIDGRSFLPAQLDLRMTGHGATGSATLAFAGIGRYWLIASAVASATLPGGDDAHERITWSGYRFPATIPRSAFTNAVPAAKHVVAPVVPVAPTEPPHAGPATRP